MSEFITNYMAWVIFAIAAWTIPWKGVALWKAAQRGSRGWFILILLINTLAIVEILYIFIFSKRRGEIREQF